MFLTQPVYWYSSGLRPETPKCIVRNIVWAAESSIMLPSNIVVYVGTPAEHESERVVFAELIRLLERWRSPVTVLVNVNLGGRQLDLVVGTATQTLVIEAKASSAPVCGSRNGPWSVSSRTGRRKAVRNAYVQAVQAKNALRDAMREHQHEIDGYPDACVVFVPKLASGSAIPSDDFKVRFCDLAALEDQFRQGGEISWPCEWWSAFAERNGLEQVFDEAAVFDERLLEAHRSLQMYLNEFTATYATAVAPYKPDTYDVRGRQRTAVELEKLLLEERENLLLQGPSGCGKSLLSLWLGHRLATAEVVPVLLECRTFDGHLGAALDRETALLGARSGSALLSAARTLSRPLAIIVDGYNECPAELRLGLTRALRAASVRYDVMIVISSQTDIDRSDLLPLCHVHVAAPSDELKGRIAALDKAAAEMLFPLMQVISTGIEASLVGQLSQQIDAGTSRFALFYSFVRDRLGPIASQGVALLCSIADVLFQRTTFSVSEREADRICASQRLDAGLVKQLVVAGVLVARSGRISFAHEMYLNAFAAEAVLREQNTDGKAMLSALSMPRFKPLRTFIMGAIEDEAMLARLIGATKDELLLDACLTGECGRAAQQIVRRAVDAAIARLKDEADRIRFHASLSHPWSVEPALESLTDWTANERALLSLLSDVVHEGHWGLEMLGVVEQVDRRLRTEFTRLRPDAIEKGIKQLRTGLFAVCFVFGGREIGIAQVMSNLSGGGLSRRSRARRQTTLMQQIWDEANSPGKLYFALALSHHGTSLDPEALEAAIACVLPFLEPEQWNVSPYHLQLELMNFVHFLPRGESQQRDRLSSALEVLLPELHPFLQGIAAEALAALGAMDAEMTQHREQVEREVSEILRDPTAEESAVTAWGVFNAQFDHPFDTVYIEVLQNLPNEQRLVLLRLACKGAPEQHGFFLSSVIKELADASDSLAIPVILRWTSLPDSRSPMPQQSIEVFIAALTALGKLGYELPEESFLFGRGSSEDVMLACGLLYYWLERREVGLGMDDIQAAVALDVLSAHPARSAGILCEISRSIWDGAERRGVQLIRAFPERMVAIARAALQHQDQIEGYFPERHLSDTASRFTVSLIGTYGSSTDLSLLRNFVDHADLADGAREALMSIEARSGLSKNN